jgi:hypothetical protein
MGVSQSKAVEFMNLGGTAYSTTSGCKTLAWCRIRPIHGQQSYEFGSWANDYADWSNCAWYLGQRIFNYGLE